jgi:DNA-binding LytR/AlgR family response regulator
MGKVKILVVEDEIVIADNICSILESLGYEPMEPVINYTEAVQVLKEEKPDLALLDIQLAGSKDGVDLAFYIKEKVGIPFIFLTSNADPRTVGRAKTLKPPAYLVKPFNRDDLYTSIELALYNFAFPEVKEEKNENANIIIKNALFVKEKNLYHKVKFENILFAKSDHVYIEIHCNNKKKYLIRNTMNDFVQDLPLHFFRVHRSYIVNLNHLDAINSRYVIIDGIEVPIGKNNREELLTRVRL